MSQGAESLHAVRKGVSRIVQPERLQNALRAVAQVHAQQIHPDCAKAWCQGVLEADNHHFENVVSTLFAVVGPELGIHIPRCEMEQVKSHETEQSRL